MSSDAGPGGFSSHDYDDDDGADCTPAMASAACGRALRKACSKKALLAKLPIIEWLPRYTLDKGVSDLIAGITVGLTVIPQGIAYALVAELPAQVDNTVYSMWY